MEPTDLEVRCRVRGGASGIQRKDGDAVAVRRGIPKVSQHLGECTFVPVSSPEPTCLWKGEGQKELNDLFWTLVRIIRKQQERLGSREFHYPKSYRKIPQRGLKSQRPE